MTACRYLPKPSAAVGVWAAHYADLSHVAELAEIGDGSVAVGAMDIPVSSNLGRM